MTPELVEAALRAAEKHRVPVGDVSVQAIAQEAGISRSTLLRRLGGSRQALDEAVRAAGVDPTGQRPVRQRAVEAAGELIGRDGLAALSLERVATTADCSVHSLYAAFAGRDGLLQAVFDHYGPIVEVEEVLAAAPGGLEATVHAVYARMAAALVREPRVMPAIISELLARPHDETLRPLARYVVGRLFAGVGAWLADQIEAGRIRDLPLWPLIQQMTSPLLLHVLLRPAAEQSPELDLPDLGSVTRMYADAFLRAVALPPP